MTPRDQAMIAAYREGRTMQSVGAEFGVTRERVRQILRQHGVATESGGARLSVARARDAARAAKDVDCMALRGMSCAEYRATPARARRAYGRQHQSAKDRGIPWLMNFGQWWRIWQVSGKWDQRGRGHGYCMARKGGAGPYSPDNVYICPASQNVRDSYLWKPFHARNRSKPVSLYEYQGRALSLSQWALITGIKQNTIYERLRRGWSLPRALTEAPALNNTRSASLQSSAAA